MRATCHFTPKDKSLLLLLIGFTTASPSPEADAGSFLRNTQHLFTFDSVNKFQN